MTDVNRRAMPRWRNVVLEQIRIVAFSLRPVALVIAAVLGIGTVLIVGEILGGGPGFDSRDTFPTALFSFLVPFAVWRADRPFGPAFLWTLPVDRRRLALARVFAGGLWLIAVLALFVSWLLSLTLLARVSPMQTLARVPLIEAVATYLLGSALVLGLRHPLRWLLGAAGVFLLMGGVSQALEPYYGVSTLLGSRALYLAAQHTWAVWKTPPGFSQWAISASLSLGTGLAALWLAASRHKEN